MTGTTRRALGSAGAATILLAGLAAPAIAEPLAHEHFHETLSNVVEGFCGDLTVRIDAVEEGNFVLTERRPDGLAYGQATVHSTISFTNLANGKALTLVSNFLDKDLKVTDNADGTLTVLVQFSGGGRWYGPDGEFIRLGSETTGADRAELVIDATTGEVLTFTPVKGDFVDGCPFILEIIG